MTEILGSDDGAERTARRRPDDGADPLPGRRSDRAGDRAADRADDPDAALPVELLGDDWDDEPEPEPAARSAQVLGALREPGSLAVASGFCLLAAALAGPSYRFDAYPSNQGVGTFANAFTNAPKVHPLQDYLTATAPTISLAVAGVLTALAALIRGRPEQPGWIRPLAAGALLACVLVLALLGLGAYRTSTYDLTQTNPNAPLASNG